MAQKQPSLEEVQGYATQLLEKETKATNDQVNSLARKTNKEWDEWEVAFRNELKKEIDCLQQDQQTMMKKLQEQHQKHESAVEQISKDLNDKGNDVKNECKELMQSLKEIQEESEAFLSDCQKFESKLPEQTKQKE